MKLILSILSVFMIVKEPAMVPFPANDIQAPVTSFGSLKQPSILGITTEETEIKEATQSDIIATKRPVTIKIAVLGDSMVDTLGPEIPSLKKELQKEFPYLRPIILNYGVGAKNIDSGIERITKEYDYLGKHVPSIASQDPDIVVLESFAYNPYPFEEGALNTHWIALANAVKTIKETLPRAKIIIATTIAPNANVFADGVPSLSFSPEGKKQKVATIKQYLDSTIKFARGEKLALADAYSISLGSDGNGKLEYINAGDNIHPSEKGAELFSQVVVQTMKEQELIP